MRRIIVIPAVLIGCMIVIWIGTVAAAQMPSQALLAPTLITLTATPPSIADTTSSSEERSLSATQNEATTCGLPTSYPYSILQWCHAIEEAAQQADLPARLIAAVMLQESGGDHLAYSSSGAVGLMQVMPSDGIAAEFMCINGPCFSNRPTTAALQDPEFNLAYGAKLLADLYAATGSYRDALFKYGPIDIGYSYADKVITIWENYN